jgi:hypothetical protein
MERATLNRLDWPKNQISFEFKIDTCPKEDLEWLASTKRLECGQWMRC